MRYDGEDEEVKKRWTTCCSFISLYSVMASVATSFFFLASSSSSYAFLLSIKSSPSLKLHIPHSSLCLSPNSPLVPHLHLPANVSNKSLHFLHFSSAQEVFELEEKAEEETQKDNQDDRRRKLCVFNLPWKFSAPDIRNLFSQCGNVKHVEMIKQKDGRNRGFAFVTVASGEEARAVIEKFNSYELEGRIIGVEFAKRMKKPSPPPPEGAVIGETRHKIYVSNLAWKVRSSHLREFFGATCKPVSARVVFESPSGRSAGYGFVSFTTKDEVEAAIAALDQKELMGRPVRLKISQKKVSESGDEANEEDSSEGQLEES